MKPLITITLFLFCLSIVSAGEIISKPVFPIQDQNITYNNSANVIINVCNINNSFSVSKLVASVYFYKGGTEIYSYSRELNPSTLEPNQSSEYILDPIDFNRLDMGVFTMMVKVDSPDNIETDKNSFTLNFSVTPSCDSDPIASQLSTSSSNNSFAYDIESITFSTMVMNSGTCITKDYAGSLCILSGEDTLFIKSLDDAEIEPNSNRIQDVEFSIANFFPGDYEAILTVEAENDIHPENNVISLTFTKENPIYDFKLGEIDIPDKIDYSLPFSIFITIENQGNADGENIDLGFQLSKNGDPMTSINSTMNIEFLAKGSSMNYEFPITEHIDNSQFLGVFALSANVTSDLDTNLDNNTATGEISIILPRSKIAERVKSMYSLDPFPEGMTYLTSSSYKTGTTFREYGDNGERQLTQDAYVAFVDTDVHARLSHLYKYSIWDEFGNNIESFDGEMPIVIDGNYDEFNPFTSEYYIDGTPVEKEIAQNLEDELFSAKKEDSSVDSNACVILVSGHRIKHGDIAFENDMNLIRNELMSEAKGHHFKEEQIIVLHSPEEEQLDSVFNVIKGANNPNKSIYFFYSGHGVEDEKGSMVLDGDDLDGQSLYSYARLAKNLKETGSPVIRVIIDACYSGLAWMAISDEFTQDKNSDQRVLIVTSTDEETEGRSVTLNKDGERLYVSDFFYRFLKAYGDEDTNGDGVTSIEECYEFSVRQPSIYHLKKGNSISLWRAYRPLKYKSGQEIIAEVNEKKSLGGSGISVEKSSSGNSKVNSKIRSETKVYYRELPGPLENFPLASNVDSLVTFRYWTIKVENLSSDEKISLYVQPILTDQWEHDVESVNIIGLASLQSGQWIGRETSYNQFTGEVKLEELNPQDTLILAYTSSSIISSILKVNEEELNISPNPARDMINIILPGRHHGPIVITNNLGKIVFTMNNTTYPTEKTTKIDLSDLIPGFYNLNINYKAKTISKRFIILK